MLLHLAQGVIKLGEQRGDSKCTLVYGQMNEPPGARARVALTGESCAGHSAAAPPPPVQPAGSACYVALRHGVRHLANVASLLACIGMRSYPFGARCATTGSLSIQHGYVSSIRKSFM